MTIKPARSPQVTAVLPICAHRACAVATTSSAVATVCTTSTRRITWAGLKKCRPTTSPGLLVAAAHCTTGSELVVVARIAPGLQISSRFSKSARLMVRSSTTASTTRSTRARSSSRALPVNRLRAASRSCSVARPRCTAFSRPWATSACIAATFASERATKTTSRPARARTCTMPTAMVPDPTTPTERRGRVTTSNPWAGVGVSASGTTCELPGSA